MKFCKFLKNFYSIYIFIVFLLVVFAAPFVGFQFKRNYDCDNIIVFIFFVLIIAVSFFLIYKLKNKLAKLWLFLHSNKGFYWIFGAGSAVMLLGQICLVLGAWFVAGWDTRNVIFPEMQMNSDYMSMYPNQIFLAGLFRRIYFFLTLKGFTFDGYYLTLVFLSAILVAISVIMLGIIAKKLFSPFIAILTFLCCMLFVGFSPYILIPYSDTFGLFCTSLILFSFTTINNKAFKWFVIMFFSIVGFFIKPTVLIVLFAIIIILISKNIKNVQLSRIKFEKKKIILSAITILLALCGFVSGFFVSDIVSNYGVEINDDRAFGITHFLMMGINLETRGAWNDDDVNISRSYKNVKERTKGNLSEWQNRLNIYGIPGVAWILFNKTLTNYADGNFTWESEIPWMVKNGGHNDIIWAIYGIDDVNNHNDFNNFMPYLRQFMWFLILLGCSFTFFRRRISNTEMVAICSLLGISLFLTIFEPDARYMFLYLPFMVLLAPSGWQVFYHIANKTFVPRFIYAFTKIQIELSNKN